MAHIDSYSHLVTATVPGDAWDEAWIALTDWKGYLASFPGGRSIRISARALENGDVKVYIQTVWSYPESLEEVRESKFSANLFLTKLHHPAYDITEEYLEDFS